jgi:hypothetical protein
LQLEGKALESHGTEIRVRDFIAQDLELLEVIEAG